MVFTAETGPLEFFKGNPQKIKTLEEGTTTKEKSLKSD